MQYAFIMFVTSPYTVCMCIAVYMKLYISNGSPIQVIFDMKPQVQDFVLDTVKLRKLNFAIKLLTCNVNFTVRHSFRAWNVKC